MSAVPDYFEFNAQQFEPEPAIVVLEEQDMSEHERDRLHREHMRYINRMMCEADEARLQRAWRMEGKR